MAKVYESTKLGWVSARSRFGMYEWGWPNEGRGTTASDDTYQTAGDALKALEAFASRLGWKRVGEARGSGEFASYRFERI